MGVATSTIVRYEAGTIDNTKKLVLEGLSEALHVSVEWLKGETEEYETDITDKRELFIRDVMSSILSKLPFDMEQTESDFTHSWRATNWLTDLSVRYLHAESISPVPIASAMAHCVLERRTNYGKRFCKERNGTIAFM